MSARSCEAVEAHFAWFSQLCGEPAFIAIEFDDESRWVCPTHLAAWNREAGA